MTKYFLLTLCLFTISCKSSTDSNGTQSQGVIMPLAVGNMWAYTDHFYGNGSVSTSTTDTLRLVSKISLGADTACLSPEETYFINRAEGLWSRLFFADTLKLIAKYPASQGEIFGHDSFVLTSESSPDPIDSGVADIIVDSTNAAVTVPAGNYSCYKYKADYYDSKHVIISRENTYYSVNVGLIKRDRYMLDSATQILKLRQSDQLTKVDLH
ncbi:MAG: hypothetical protein Q8916_05415 [Bacteroidota bacterium]|nr:hypothetical protein [Bacteroidota bacterium]MDP4229828.1 hypothetical protein [Bacteroidota bacterium]